MNNRTKELSKEWPIIFVVDDATACDLLDLPTKEMLYLPFESSGEFQNAQFKIVVVDALTSKKRYHVMFKQEEHDLAMMFRLTYSCERVYAPTGI